MRCGETRIIGREQIDRAAERYEGGKAKLLRQDDSKRYSDEGTPRSEGFVGDLVRLKQSRRRIRLRDRR